MMISHLSLRDSKSPQVTRTLLSILADFNNVVVWMVSTHPLIFKSFSSFINLLMTVSSAPITIGITVTFMFHSFFSSLARSRNISLFSPSFSFIMSSAGTAESTLRKVFSFFCWLSESLVVWSILGDPFVSQNPREVCASHFPVRIVHYYYYCALLLLLLLLLLLFTWKLMIDSKIIDF